MRRWQTQGRTFVPETLLAARPPERLTALRGLGRVPRLPIEIPYSHSAVSLWLYSGVIGRIRVNAKAALHPVTPGVVAFARSLALISRG